jgi:3-dehydroquinate dehydratase
MNTLFIIIGILGLVMITLGIFIGKLSNRLSQLTGGKNVHSLETIIKENNMMILDLNTKIQNHEEQILDLKKEAMNSIQNIGVVRFNPFKETGGNQSFAIALTDKKKNGVILSSLYSRDRVNVFAKPIKNGSSEYTLTDEEHSAITQSQSN